MKAKFDITPINQWGLPTQEKPLVIAGPCSAESEAQVMETAQSLKNIGIKIFRAGIWKPRTRPNAFEGIGVKGLPWLKRVKEELGMLTATEVANAGHVEAALKAGVDILWIGARTTVSPFAAQEIADAIKGIDNPVLIKNPVNPDLQLWLGAIERINLAGIKKIAVIHRGFSTFKKMKYRNIPQWQLPIELKRLHPEIPLICDPSHIAGQRAYIEEITQKSLDLNFDGLIIESHRDPDKALSDASQQVSPRQLGEILHRLVLRKEETKNQTVTNTLSELRSIIDKFDEDLLQLLAERFNISQTIGHYKRENGITILQNRRWDQIVKTRLQRANELGLASVFIENIFKIIHQESINKQEEVMNANY